jgi:prepilin-type N-terminal cleavage/methylation domain-containing protein
MKLIHRKSRGFTLIEIIIVLGILSIVMGAAFSLYLVHMKTAYTQDEVVEVQQNLRIAMDSLTRDLQIAGAFVPLSVTPIAQNGFSSYSTSLSINTGSPEGRFVRINKSAPQIPGPLSNYTTTVESPMSAAGFNVNDRVRIIRPYDNSTPFSNYSALVITASAVNPLGVGLQIQSSATAIPFPSGVAVNPGDVIAKINTPAVNSYPAHNAAPYNTIVYSIVTGAANNCPAGSCLARQVNPASPIPTANEIVASNLSHLSLSYLFDNNLVPETQNPSGSESTLKAVRITLTGVTTRKTDSNWHSRTRQMSTLVKLRNRRMN